MPAVPAAITLALGLLSALLNVLQFALGRRDRSQDEAMRYGDHWRNEAQALFEDNERLRQRITDTENHCAAEMAALRTENDALGTRLLELLKKPGGPPP